MAISNFSELKTAISSWADRSDLTSTNLEEFIRLAESRFEREIRIIGMIKRSTADVTTRFLSLPDGYTEMRSLKLNTSPVTNLTQVSPEVMAERFQLNTNGKPLYFTVHEEIEFNRTPDKTYKAELLHWAKLGRLSDSNTTNALLTNHPDIYLSGSMVEASRFIHDDDGEVRWNTRYELFRAAANKLFIRGQYSRGPLTTTIDGPTP